MKSSLGFTVIDEAAFIAQAALFDIGFSETLETLRRQ